MNRLDEIHRLLDAAKRADTQGPLPYAFAASPIVEAMEALLPLLREVTSARVAIESLEPSSGGHIPGLGEAADRAARAGDALLAHLRGEP
jgi:hypothetical protein